MITKRNNHGLNLIELMTVLFIAAVLLLASVPYFSDMLQEFRTSSIANNLYYTIQYARSEAIKSNTNVYLSFSTGDTWCYGLNKNSACTCTVASSCGLGVYSAPAAQQVTLSLSGLSGTSFYFEGTHGAASASPTITLTPYGESSYIKVLVLQLLTQMCSSGISGYWKC